MPATTDEEAQRQLLRRLQVPLKRSARTLPSIRMPDGSVEQVQSLNATGVWDRFRHQLLAQRSGRTRTSSGPVAAPAVVEPMGPPVGFGRGSHDEDESGSRRQRPYEHVVMGPEGTRFEHGPRNPRNQDEIPIR